MAGVETAGLILGSIPLLISIPESYSQLRDYRLVAREKELGRIKEYGLITTIFLHTLFRDAFFVMEKVEQFVIHAEDQKVMAFIKSYTANFNMIGVAGAIIAQVAITAISLTRLEDSHWASEAFFVGSLVTGSLSVFFSCAISPAFHGLHSADEVKTFLTKPATVTKQVGLKKQFSELKKSPSPTVEDIVGLRGQVHKEIWKVASAQAAIMLVVPMTLLNLALNSFLIGLGIYLGKLYTANLVPSYGKGSLGILIFFLGSAVLGIGAFYIPQSLKQQESVLLRGWLQMLDYKNQVPPIQPTEGGRGNGQANGRDETQKHLNGFLQSTHKRRNGKIGYTVGNDVIKRDKEEIELDCLSNKYLVGREDPIPSAKRQDHECPARYEAQAGNAGQPFTTPHSQSIRSALIDFIKAQGDSLHASNRILEAFDATSEEDSRLYS